MLVVVAALGGATAAATLGADADQRGLVVADGPDHHRHFFFVVKAGVEANGDVEVDLRTGQEKVRILPTLSPTEIFQYWKGIKNLMSQFRSILRQLASQC